MQNGYIESFMVNDSVAVAAPPRTAMKSRRLKSAPMLRTTIVTARRSTPEGF